MALIVQKYGGTSVGSIEKIGNVADKVCTRVRKGDKVVVAVSAMSGETNRLIALANEMSEQPHPREMARHVFVTFNVMLFGTILITVRSLS
jgi:aspartate kinase